MSDIFKELSVPFETIMVMWTRASLNAYGSYLFEFVSQAAFYIKLGRSYKLEKTIMNQFNVRKRGGVWRRTEKSEGV